MSYSDDYVSVDLAITFVILEYGHVKYFGNQPKCMHIVAVRSYTGGELVFCH